MYEAPDSKEHCHLSLQDSKSQAQVWTSTSLDTGVNSPKSSNSLSASAGQSLPNLPDFPHALEALGFTKFLSCSNSHLLRGCSLEKQLF